MKLLLLFFAAAATKASQDDWCNECTTIVDTFDTMDATTLADDICSLFDSNGICEDIAPYMIEWVQDHCDSETICESLCDVESGKFFIIDDNYLPRPTRFDDTWCTECKNIVESFDDLDATTLQTIFALLFNTMVFVKISHPT